MNWKIWFVLGTFLLCRGGMAAEAQSPTKKSSKLGPVSAQLEKTIDVPERVAKLVRPFLDEQGKSGRRDEDLLSELMYGLAKREGNAADEALVS